LLGRAQPGVREEHVAGQLLEALNLVGGHAQVTRLQLRLVPRQFVSALGFPEIVIFLDELEDTLASIGRDGDKRELRPLSGLEPVGDSEAARSTGAIDQRDAANFGVVLWRHDDLAPGLDPDVAALERGSIRLERDQIARWNSTDRLIGGRPGRALLDILDVDE